MQVVCFQLNIRWEDKAANFSTIRRMLEASVPEAGSLVVLPEMFSTGFSMNVQSIAEGEPSETAAFLADCARRFGVWMLGGLVTPFPDGCGRNEALVVDPLGTETLRYAKIHPFSFGGEGEFYSGGDAIKTFKWQGFVVAPFICYDLRFPEVFRLAVQKGAQLFPVIANWPAVREAHWITLLKARAIENQAYVVGVNRCGADPKLEYSGRSIIIDPHGEILADAGTEQGVASADVDLEELKKWRAEFPALRDIRYENGGVWG
jgi:omega-amidase